MRPSFSLALSALIFGTAIMFVPATACAAGSTKAPVKTTGKQVAVPPEKPTEEKFGEWLLVCQKIDAKTKKCFVAQEIQGKFQGADKKEIRGRLARITFLRQKTKKSDLLMSALLPLGINLQAGAAFSIDDGKQISIPLVRCTNAGCEALLPVDDSLLQQLKKAKNLKLGYNAGVKTLVVPFSMTGFNDAMAKLP